LPLLLLLLLAVGGIVWALNVPGGQFLPAFAGLLTAPAIQRGPFSFFSGRSYALGKFRERDVVIRLQLKRSRYGQGYLVVTVRTTNPATLDAAGIDSLVADAGGRRALYTIAMQDLRLSAEGGWLKAEWSPQGFIIFPGRFSAEKWQAVLDAMTTTAASLEAVP
jgi:hypothetical protein